jgi:hypothetical protein
MFAVNGNGQLFSFTASRLYTAASVHRWSGTPDYWSEVVYDENINAIFGITNGCRCNLASIQRPVCSPLVPLPDRVVRRPVPLPPLPTR